MGGLRNVKGVVGRVQVGRRCRDEELIVSTCLRQLNQLRLTNPLGNPNSRSGSQTVDPRRICPSEYGPFTFTRDTWVVQK